MNDPLVFENLDLQSGTALPGRPSANNIPDYTKVFTLR
jgi:hypothetical protein